MSHTVMTALLPLAALLLPLGAAIKGEYELNGGRLWGFGRRPRTREELRRSLRVIQGGLLAAGQTTEALPAQRGAGAGS